MITKDNILEILKFLPYFEDPQNHFYHIEYENLFTPYCYSQQVEDFEQALYSNSIIQSFDWGSWQQEAEQIIQHPDRIDTIDFETLCKLFTVHIRAERFTSGHLAQMIDNQHILRLLKRLQVLAAHWDSNEKQQSLPELSSQNMFTADDLTILKQPGSWEKVTKVQEAFFPKLLALQIEANKLIKEIYGINVNLCYNISQTPTTPSRKGQTYNAQRRQNDNYVLVGLRAAGVPSNLTRINGKACEFHFGLLAFAIYPFQEEDGGFLTIQFAPYYLQYAHHHLYDLSEAVRLHEVQNIVVDCGDWFYTPEKLSLIETLKQPNGYIMVNLVNPVSATQQDFAKLVILYAACFPMIDLFTRLSNGEKVFVVKEDNETSPVNKPDYTKLFYEWRAQKADKFINEFTFEPIQQQAIWQAEALTRSLFEEIIGKPFPKIRPSWMKSKSSKASLELDGYCEELQLAFEYQGEYHYMEIPVHHQQRSLKDVQKNDALKVQLCQKQGVNLIQVPYWEKGNQIWIIQELQKLEHPEINNILTNKVANII